MSLRRITRKPARSLARVVCLQCMLLLDQQRCYLVEHTACIRGGKTIFSSYPYALTNWPVVRNNADCTSLQRKRRTASMEPPDEDTLLAAR